MISFFQFYNVEVEEEMPLRTATISCDTCKQLLKGEKAARDHMDETGHLVFSFRSEEFV